MHHLIRHHLVIWDEAEHVSRKRLVELDAPFKAAYARVFPESTRADESPAVVATNSPFFKADPVTAFWSGGKLHPYSGQAKDLAIAKYCASGFLDQNERFRFLVDDMRDKRHAKGDVPMSANGTVMVTFVTTDVASGMNKALAEVHSASRLVHFASFQFPKVLTNGGDRLAHCGEAIGTELARRFVRLQGGGLVLDL